MEVSTHEEGVPRSTRSFQDINHVLGAMQCKLHMDTKHQRKTKYIKDEYTHDFYHLYVTKEFSSWSNDYLTSHVFE